METSLLSQFFTPLEWLRSVYVLACVRTVLYLSCQMFPNRSGFRLHEHFLRLKTLLTYKTKVTRLPFRSLQRKPFQPTILLILINHSSRYQRQPSSNVVSRIQLVSRGEPFKQISFLRKAFVAKCCNPYNGSCVESGNSLTDWTTRALLMLPEPAV